VHHGDERLTGIEKGIATRGARVHGAKEKNVSWVNWSLLRRLNPDSAESGYKAWWKKTEIDQSTLSGGYDPCFQLGSQESVENVEV